MGSLRGLEIIPIVSRIFGKYVFVQTGPPLKRTAQGTAAGSCLSPFKCLQHKPGTINMQKQLQGIRVPNQAVMNE